MIIKDLKWGYNLNEKINFNYYSNMCGFCYF